jgi:hypothetical protein
MWIMINNYNLLKGSQLLKEKGRIIAIPLFEKLINWKLDKKIRGDLNGQSSKLPYARR